MADRTGESIPLATALDRDSLIAAAQAEGRSVDLTDAVLHSGWENVVLETADGWILRFPRDSGVDFERELATLDRLRGRLPAAIPEVEWTGKLTRFAAYRKLDGAVFDPDVYGGAPARQRDALAESLARFLYAMHTTFTAGEIEELGIPGAGADHPDEDHPGITRIVAEMDRIPFTARADVERLLEAYAAAWPQRHRNEPRVVLHNDFHTDNMVLASPAGQVTGVWDFSCVELGPPSMDLRYFEDGPPDLLRRLAEQYGRVSGNSVDVRAAVLANRIEAVSDALETNEPGSIPSMVDRWRRLFSSS